MTTSRELNRAEAVRQRRKQRAANYPRRKKRRGGKARGAQLPPMVSRHRSRGLGYAKPSRGKNRRRYDIELGIPGAEVRLPSVPAIQFGWRVLSGLLVVLSIGLLYTLWNSPTYQVRTAEVEGIERLTIAEINTVIKVGGKPIFAIEPRRLERELQEAFPELYDIRVQVQFPAEVKVVVAERQPILIWKQAGNTFWVDENGVAFPQREEKDGLHTLSVIDSPDLEVYVTSSGSTPLAKPDFVQAVLTLGKDAPPDTTILYDRKHGLGWDDARGWQVFFGVDLNTMADKTRMYAAIVKHLKREKIRPSFISIENIHAPYYRMD